jgi:hypothetical protein
VASAAVVAVEVAAVAEAARDEQESEAGECASSCKVVAASDAAAGSWAEPS